MKLSRRPHAALVWLLYASVLFSLLACGLHHGQSAGLRLSGLQGSVCGQADGWGGADDIAELEQGILPVTGHACPLCNGFLLPSMLALLLAWLLLTERPLLRFRSLGARISPRYCWPSANPRASPAF